MLAAGSGRGVRKMSRQGLCGALVLGIPLRLSDNTGLSLRADAYRQNCNLCCSHNHTSTPYDTNRPCLVHHNTCRPRHVTNPLLRQQHEEDIPRLTYNAPPSTSILQALRAYNPCQLSHPAKESLRRTIVRCRAQQLAKYLVTPPTPRKDQRRRSL